MNRYNLVTNGLIDNFVIDEKGKGHKFVSKFIEAGLVHYKEYGDILITKETLDKFIGTMVGCPVIINHKQVTDDNVENERVGVISNVWFNPSDGWYYCDGIIWNKQAIDLVKNQGWNVSCAYSFESDRKPLKYHGKTISMEFTNGNFQHLAIVETPRYEDANIVINSVEFDESKHPRDEQGKFTKFDTKTVNIQWSDSDKSNWKGYVGKNYRKSKSKYYPQKIGNTEYEIRISNHNRALKGSGQWNDDSYETLDFKGIPVKISEDFIYGYTLDADIVLEKMSDFDIIKNDLTKYLKEKIANTFEKWNKENPKLWHYVDNNNESEQMDLDKAKEILKEYLSEDVYNCVFNGGAGSGDFDHAGRPTLVGGSEPAGTGRNGKYEGGHKQWIGAKPKQQSLFETKSEKANIPEKNSNIDSLEDFAKRENKQSDTKEGEEKKKSTFKPVKGIMQSLKDDYEAGKISAKEVAKELSKANLTPYLLDNNEALEKIGVKQSDSTAEKEHEDIKEMLKKVRPDLHFNYNKNSKYPYEIKYREDKRFNLNDIATSSDKKEDIYEYLRQQTKQGSDIEKELTAKIKETKENKNTELKNIVHNREKRKENLVMTALNDLENFVKNIVSNACEKDKEKEVMNEDKRKLIDEVGGILKGKVDDEIIRTIIGKLEKVAYEPSEDNKAVNKCKNEDEEDKKEFIKEKEIATGKKDTVENSMDKVRKAIYSSSQVDSSSVYMTREERIEQGNKY